MSFYDNTFGLCIPPLESRNDPHTKKKVGAGCSLLRAAAVSFSFYVLLGGLEINILQFLSILTMYFLVTQ